MFVQYPRQYHHHHHCHHFNRCSCGYCYDCGTYVMQTWRPMYPWYLQQTYPYWYTLTNQSSGPNHTVSLNTSSTNKPSCNHSH